MTERQRLAEDDAQLIAEARSKKVVEVDLFQRLADRLSALSTENAKLRIGLADWQASSEAYRLDSERLASELEQARGLLAEIKWQQAFDGRDWIERRDAFLSQLKRNPEAPWPWTSGNG